MAVFRDLLLFPVGVVAAVCVLLYPVLAGVGAYGLDYALGGLTGGCRVLLADGVAEGITSKVFAASGMTIWTLCSVAFYMGLFGIGACNEATHRMMRSLINGGLLGLTLCALLVPVLSKAPCLLSAGGLF